jgi:hypothetical protein
MTNRNQVTMFVLLVMAALLVATCFSYSGLAAADTGGKLVAEYKFAGDAKDATGNGHDGTVAGNVSFASDGPAGQCAVFDGSSYIKVADSADLRLPGPYTISTWLKVDQQGSDMGGINSPVVSKTEDGSPSYDGTSTSGGNTYAAYGIGDNMFTMSETYYGGSANGFTGQNTTAQGIDLTNGWVLVTATNDGANMYLYVNGELKDTQPVQTTYPLLPSTGEVLIGAEQDGAGNNVYLKGRLADLRIYNYALGSDDIKALYSGGSQGGAQGSSQGASQGGSQGSSQGTSTGYADSILLTINWPLITVDLGQPQYIDPNNPGVAPVIVGGRTLVPIGAIINAMGGSVQWNGDERSITISLKGQTIKLVLSSTTAEVNGTAVTMDVPPQSLNGRTMVPIRFVSEQLGCPVKWDGPNQTITINFNK